MKQAFEVFYKGHSLLGKIECDKKDRFKKAKDLIVERKDAFYYAGHADHVQKVFLKKSKGLKNWKDLEKHLVIKPYSKIRYWQNINSTTNE